MSVGQVATPLGGTALSCARRVGHGHALVDGCPRPEAIGLVRWFTPQAVLLRRYVRGEAVIGSLWVTQPASHIHTVTSGPVRSAAKRRDHG